MQCPRCQQENRPSARFCDGCGTPLKRAAENDTPAPSYADLQRFRAAALDQQAAGGISDRGQIVGSYFEKSIQHGFVLDPDRH